MTDFQCILEEKEMGLYSGLIVKKEWIMTPSYLVWQVGAIYSRVEDWVEQNWEWKSRIQVWAEV